MERLKSLSTWWDTNQQALRIFFYTTLPILGVKAGDLDVWWSGVVQLITILGLVANLWWTIKWNKKSVITMGGLKEAVANPAVSDVVTNAALTIEAAKRAIRKQ